ncbi:hypothetical protein [Janibacter sp. GS2]|uniref:hypothetical protein n=1 Tax=Janibacter sp. GS2 TaxID=3442646 RepID=UPI003EC0147A
MDLSAAVDELYGADPADFVAVRGRLVGAARSADEPDLAAELATLRKPTLVAWLLNRVARDEPGVIADLLDLGERMRTAQAKGDGAALAAARPERHAAIEALVDAARRCAGTTGSRFGPAAADGVSATAVAALADPASGRALASGRLLRPLAYAGFGEVELDDAVAVLRLVPPMADSEEGEGAGEDPETQTLAHDRALAEARDALRGSERDLSAARLTLSQARATLEHATAAVERLDDQVTRAARRVTDLETRR